MKFRSVFLCAAVLVTAARFSDAQPTAAPSDPGAPAQIGRWTARFERAGFFLDFDGVPIVRGGIVQLFGPEYKRGYYSSGSSRQALTAEPLPDGGRAYTAEYQYAGDGNSFRATQRIEIHTDNTVHFTLRSRWEGSEPVLLEWNAARLWAYPLLGAPYEAVPNGPDPAGARQGQIPLRPRPNRALANRVAEAWSRLLLRLPALGDLTLTSESPDAPQESPALLDGRNDPYLQNDRVFWLGFPAVTLDSGHERVLTLTLALAPRSSTPLPRYVAGPSQERLTHVVAVTGADAWERLPEDASGHPVLIPQPKHVAFTYRDFLLRGRLPITVALPAGEAGDRAARAARDFAAEIGLRTGVRWNERRIAPGGHWNRQGLLVTTLGAEALPQPLTPALTLHPEGYALVVTPQFVAVVGRDPAGAFYGLQTLRQLLRPADTVGRHGPARFVGADITDWPSLRMRAAHIFGGKEALVHRNLIDRIFSRYKLNTLVIECEYTRWKSHPEIWQPYSMDPEDLRQDVAYARGRFMEPIPLINSLGHSEWIFKNGQHLDLAEDVKAPHAYDASNPETYRFLFGVFDEALDIFKPRYFHIGHDEVRVPSFDQFGKYPARLQNIEKGAAALFIEDTNRLAAWLKPRGVTPILWADMLLYASEGDKARGPAMVAANAPSLAEAEKMRGQLPKDAVIADWRYEAGSEQRNGVEIFRAGGHEVLGSAWFSPENIRGWARQCIEKEALGTLQTTWAGYDSKEALLDEEYRQFTAFVLAAEYAWSGTSLHPRPVIPDGSVAESEMLPYDAADIFAASYRDVPAPTAKQRAWSLDLRGASNVLLSPGTSGSLIAYGGPRAGRSEAVRPKRTALAADDAAHGYSSSDIQNGLIDLHGILLHGLLDPEFLQSGPTGAGTGAPGSVTLPVGAMARELQFTHTTLQGMQTGALIATYTMEYSDGTSVDAHLRYGREIRALDDGAADQMISTSRLPATSAGAVLRVYRWRNPHPELTIKQIRFRTDNPLASPILFGITGCL